MSAQQKEVALPLRNYTILGACEAIGEDFGFNPLYLRIPFAASVLWSPLMAIGAYLALGGVVLLSRVAFPNRKLSAGVETAQSSQSGPEEPELPLAA